MSEVVQRRAGVQAAAICAAMPLSMAAVGQELILAGVEGGREFQHRLAEMGLMPGARLRVLAHGGGPFVIAVKAARLVLGKGAVARVLVRPCR